MFTYHYAQPEEYHFSLDSIQLAELVATHLQDRKDLASLRVLDLCAGCGVIGIELSWYVRELRQIDFVDVQDIYTPYFQKNVTTVNRPELQLRWHVLNYDVLLDASWQNKFDVIISNPPYFQPEQGMLSPSEFKNRCRFFLDSTFQKFILAISNTLAAGGQAYFLLRSLSQHGCDVFLSMQELLKEIPVSVEKISHVRGTDVVLMKK